MPNRAFGRASFLAGLSSAAALAGCSSNNATAPLPGPTPATIPVPALPAPGPTVADLRFGFAPNPAGNPSGGYDPAGDARALFLSGTPSPATAPIPGSQTTFGLGPAERYVIRVPKNWNGKLVVAGTPATRSEFANDAIWSDFALSLGYAFASSNKGIPYNAILTPAAAAASSTQTFPISFDTPILGGLEKSNYVFQLGALTPVPVSVASWNVDFAALTQAAQAFLKLNFAAPTRTYAVGLSNGGAQVRSLLENFPQLVDGGVDWAGVFWSPSLNILTYLPKFLAAMPRYVASGFTDAGAAAAIAAAGYPADIRQASATHPSLYLDYYAGFPYYADLTVFEYALLIDPLATSQWQPPVCIPDASAPLVVEGTCAGTGLALPQNRAAYTLSPAGAQNVAKFSHSGNIGKPLVSIAGAADMFVTVPNNATPYLNAVNASGKSSNYWQYIVQGGTHVDPFAAFGYGLQPQAPFAWAAFNQMVAVVERGLRPPGAGSQQSVATPSQIAVA